MYLFSDKVFWGTYHNQLDDKGRIRVPAQLRKLLGDDAVMFCSDDRCMCIYTKEGFEEFTSARFKDIDLLGDKETVRTERKIYSSMMPFVEDKQGRVSLSADFIARCGFKKNLVTMGIKNRVEIWSEENYNRYFGLDEPDGETD